MRRVRSTFHSGLFHATAFGKAVAARRMRRLALELHEFGVVDISAEGIPHADQVGFTTVRSELHAVARREVTSCMNSTA